MKKTYSGIYKVEHPQMYKGNVDNVEFRSSWEKACFKWLDGNSKVEWWASEEFVVPYYYDVDKKMHRYFVDLSIKWKNGKLMLIEVKPKKQTKPPKEPQRKTKRYLNEVKTWGVNSSKWKYAVEWCENNGMEFQILTEDDLGIRYK